MLHLLEQGVVDEKAFNQSHVTEARKQVATALINEKSPSCLHTCEVFRNCFPLLQVAEGSSSTPIIDCTDDLERVVSGPTPVGAVDNIKRTDGDDDDDLALLVLGPDTITATLTRIKSPKEIRKDMKINELLSGATNLLTQTNLHYTNDISDRAKTNKDDDEYFDTLLDTDIDTDNDDSYIEDTAASQAENDDSVSAPSGDTAFYDLMRESKLQCFPSIEAMNPGIGK